MKYTLELIRAEGGRITLPPGAVAIQQDCSGTAVWAMVPVHEPEDPVVVRTISWAVWIWCVAVAITAFLAIFFSWKGTS